uniref:Uncharacterized AAA domain-containing protein ycf46 n=1 Tax=Ophidocladus simpliciusculus TaxID=1261574 RepID=A0A1Z1MJA1_9FLOR|nr:hypothetical protein [Ophidocladus simpliciusculus]ARW65895.1 hypothetical protein [Ophidocladus simpliciusculus]
MNFQKKIVMLLSSNNHITYIMTKEEDRLEYILKDISKKLFKENLYCWNFIDGYKNNPNYWEYGKKNPLEALEIIEKDESIQTRIFLLKDFYLFTNDTSINRKLKNLYILLKKRNKYIIISGTESNITKTLKEYITYIKMPLPNKEEIGMEITKFLTTKQNKYNTLIETFAVAYLGLSTNRIRKSISELMTYKKSEKEILKEILKEKEKIVQQESILELNNANKKIIEIGGLKYLKKWLKIRYLKCTNQALTYGLQATKGILLVGVQGTGKSLSARTISIEWNLPLLKLDISKIFTGILGESEKKMQGMIETCEQISPCILWIDEIDKIFMQRSNYYDSGTTSRITNIFLTWLSERKKSVFIIATANTINDLPIEMLRKGRFDEIFFVDLPNLMERINIFKIHLKQVRPLTWHTYNIYYLGKISRKFSGAEIEQVINEAMHIAFYEKREFTTNDIVKSIKYTIPLAKTEESNISKIRKWGYSGKVKIA